jgi:starch phosphorylase
MVKEYTTRFYVPQIQQGQRVEQNAYELARALAQWKERIQQRWDSLALYVEGQREGQLSLGESIEVRAWVRAQDITPDDLLVELVYGESGDGEQVSNQRAIAMQYRQREEDGSYRYEARFQPEESGSLVYGVRVLPNHPLLAGKHDMGLVRWA